MHTEICDLLGIEYPIFGFTHCRDVVAAVSRAGGLGVLGALEFEPDQLELELRWIDDHVDGKPYGVDVVMPQKQRAGNSPAPPDLDALRAQIPEKHKRFVRDLMDRFSLAPLNPEEEPAEIVTWTEQAAREQVDAAFEHPIALIASALGSPPADIVERAHNRGVLVAALCGKAEQARRHVATGVDIVVAQSYEAGGHTGDIGSMVLVPEIVDAASPVPVLAAGGIGSGRQIAAALALGAQGVWMGTAWLTTAESGTEMIERYLAATSSDTVRTRCESGKPGRMLRSPWTDAWETRESPEPLPMPLQSLACAEATTRMKRAHRTDLMAAGAGQVIGRLNRVVPVRDLIFEMVEEYIDTMERMDSFMERSSS